MGFKYGYYIVGLIGFVLGLSWPGKSWLWPIAHYLGQFLYWFIGLLLFSKGHGNKFLIPLAIGLISLSQFCLPALVMSLAGGVFVNLLRNHPKDVKRELTINSVTS